MTATNEILQLAALALDEFEAVSLSASIRRASRLARLTGDGAAALLFRSDLGMSGGSGWLRLMDARRLFPDHTVDQIDATSIDVTERWIEERQPRILASHPKLIPPGSVLSGSVEALESDLRELSSTADTEGEPLRAELRAAAGLRREVLEG